MTELLALTDAEAILMFPIALMAGVAILAIFAIFAHRRDR